MLLRDGNPVVGLRQKARERFEAERREEFGVTWNEPTTPRLLGGKDRQGYEMNAKQNAAVVSLKTRGTLRSAAETAASAQRFIAKTRSAQGFARFARRRSGLREPCQRF